VQSLTGPNNCTLLSHLRLCSLSVASYDSQGLRWRYSNPPPHGVGSCELPLSIYIAAISYFVMKDWLIEHNRISTCLCVCPLKNVFPTSLIPFMKLDANVIPLFVVTTDNTNMVTVRTSEVQVTLTSLKPNMGTETFEYSLIRCAFEE
jgi:hypothetical protein